MLWVAVTFSSIDSSAKIACCFQLSKKLMFFSSDNILVFNKLTNAFSYLEKLGLEKKQVYALFENDLPDIYNEGVDKNEN